MELWPALLLFTELLFLTQALDDDEARKYTVSFFQFNPKDLGVNVAQRIHTKRDFKRGDVDNSPKTDTNNTIAISNSTAVRNPISSNKTSENTNATSSSVSNNSTSKGMSNATLSNPPAIVNNTDSVANGNTSASLNNSTDSQASSTKPGEARDTDISIMNTLIGLAMKKNYTKTRNVDGKDIKPVNIDISGSFNAKNTTISNPKLVINSGNSTSNSTTNSKSTPGQKKTVIAASPVNAAPRRKDLLNPNPKPSETEAMLNLKKPSQLENAEHNPLIHSENTTKSEITEDKEAVITNNVSMVKNENKEGSKKNEAEHVVELSAAEKEKLKIEKDKETNKQIQENAKSIQPVTNTVGSMNTSMGNIPDNTPKSQVEHLGPDKIKHRKKVAKFVPLYKTSPKDHKLSFQIGSLKHPKHSIHPRCHACPQMSSYKECVKKSTLLECSKGLNNICFTKSTKKNGIITYQMGCADHNKCVNAKAFPCKDGREHCFTCCQYDRCNSSPHHGDFELDELNLDELTSESPKIAGENTETTKLDSSAAINTIGSSWITYGCTVLAVVALHL